MVSTPSVETIKPLQVQEFGIITTIFPYPTFPQLGIQPISAVRAHANLS